MTVFIFPILVHFTSLEVERATPTEHIILLTGGKKTGWKISYFDVADSFPVSLREKKKKNEDLQCVAPHSQSRAEATDSTQLY